MSLGLKGVGLAAPAACATAGARAATAASATLWAQGAGRGARGPASTPFFGQGAGPRTTSSPLRAHTDQALKGRDKAWCCVAVADAAHLR